MNITGRIEEIAEAEANPEEEVQRTMNIHKEKITETTQKPCPSKAGGT